MLSEALCLKVDESVPDTAAAPVEPLGIAVHAVARAGLQDGDVAVVVGCGPIGLAITAVLAIRGAAMIVASELSPRRRALACRAGWCCRRRRTRGSSYRASPRVRRASSRWWRS
ncbi:MAG: hypothetical protein LW722_15025 [Rubrivivax sp.]|nr:hypothetical protein [Rubrivivax sp.]MCA3256909.1 hypothetical protein [Rubrivivax sp.]MCE2913430.1 hypothetical protein [Rubrivivax sp.]MCZ8032769.1 hypothetical protein [Rubrivivax sp.]